MSAPPTNGCAIQPRHARPHRQHRILHGRPRFVSRERHRRLRAAISFYGGGIAPALLPRAANLHAPMLFFWGGLDKHIPQDQIRSVIDAVRSCGKPYINVEISDADDGFFCDARPSVQSGRGERSVEPGDEFSRSAR